MYGRAEAEWERLVVAGKAILIARAVVDRTISYGEFAAALARCTGHPRFDFTTADGRAGMAYLVERISGAAFEEAGGRLLGAYVRDLGADDAGPGFYRLASRKGLAVPRTRGGRRLFWADHVRELHEHFVSAVPRPASR
ncbi:hypothetical protein ACWEVP_30100 [Amycolatopsis sp. NPDC003865]